jgi:hypothetical protein
MDPLSELAMPRVLSPRPVRVWVVIGLFALYLCVCAGLLFESVAPVANFPVRPNIAADSGAYWAYSGAKKNIKIEDGATTEVGSNLLGPVTEGRLLRTDFNVFAFNSLMFVSCLWLLRTMPEFDRATFLLLIMANPFLISALTTLNKEIFALTGIVYFVAYTRAKRFRLLLLFAALALSLMARWQQAFILLLYLGFETWPSPFRNRRRAGLLVTLLAFTIGYALVYRLIPSSLQGLLVQAELGRTIVILNNVQAHFGFPLVVIPKILMDCMGHFIQPWYFVTDYLVQNFENWNEQIFQNIHSVLLTGFLVILFFTRKLKLRSSATYILALYLMMIAVSPIVQPRYEYTAYVLLCLEASRYWRLGAAPAPEQPLLAAPA